MRSGTFSGTLYGNGHTITVTGSQTYTGLATGFANETYIGGLVSKLTGKIYDLNVVLATNTSASFRSSGDGTLRVGLIAGVLDRGGVIENCTVTINSGSRLAAHKESSGDNWASAGAVAGGTNGSMTIRNVTVTNNGDIASGLSSGSLSENFNYNSKASASMFVSFIWNDQSSYTQIINNVVAKGSGSIRGYVCSILGMLFKSVKAITVGNYYNLFSGTYDYGNSGWSSYTAFVSYTLFKWETGDQSTVTNYYNGPNTDESKMASGYYAVPSNSIEVDTATYNIFFDPSKADLNNSLGITYSASNPPAGYERTYTLTAKNGSSWTTKDIVDGKVIFTGLPTAAGTWTSGGNFSATLTYTDTKLPTLDPLTEYEHGYYAGSTPSGTAISTGDDFFNKFIDRNSGNPSGNYYLTKDIFITGFTGKEFSGTLDGNGKTIYIVGAQAGTNGSNIGGLVGTLTGTIKNVRVVIYSDVNVDAGSKSGDDVVAVGIGGIAGKITGNGRVENVSVVIKEGVTFKNSWSGSGSDRAIGGIAGEMIGSGSVKNCTVQLDGYMLSESGWPFAAGIVGITEDLSDNGSVTYENIILKGSGQLGGYAHNPNQPTFAAAITTTQPGSVHEFTVNGFIYDMTNPNGPTTGALNNETQLTAGKVSSFGYVCQNNDGGSGTSEGLSPEGIISYSNIFDYNCSMSKHLKYHDVGDGNVYYNISRDASIATAVDGLGGSSVTPYFRPGSSTDITLVATANSWGTYNLLKARGDSTAISVTKDNTKVVDVPKNEAYYDGSITLEKVKTVSEPVISGGLAYTGEKLSYTVTIQYNDAQLSESDYTVSLVGDGSVINAGDYELEVTLSNGYYFYDSASDTASNTKNVTMTVSKANVYLTVKLGVNSVEYGGSAVSGNPYVSDTGNPQISVEELGEVSYTYNDQSALPINAGEYIVKAASVSDSTNIDIVTVYPAMLNVTEKTLTLGVTEVVKQFTEITSLNKNSVDIYGDLKLAGFVDAVTGYSVSLNDESAAYITDIDGVSYLPAGEYAVVLTPDSANYTFGGNDSVTLTVTKSESANSFVTDFARAGWIYYSEPTAPTDAVARFGEPVVKYYSDAEKSNEVEEFTNLTPAGTYYYTVTVKGTGSYNGLTAEGEFVVDKLSVTVSLSAEKAVYTAKPYAGAITVTVTGTDDSTYPADILDDITYSIDVQYRQ